MTTADELSKDVGRIFREQWTLRDGQGVPNDANLLLGSNDAMKLDATVLYADLVDSTDLVDHYRAPFTAEIYKAFLHVSSKVIRDVGGSIVAFDGDRVMAVYLGGTKNSNAAKAALKINWAVRNVINPAIRKQYPTTTYVVRQVVGIDTSDLLVARTGIRNANDLVWVGRAANYAAKLSALRDEGFATVVTDDVYRRLSEETKLGGKLKTSMWQKTIWPEKGITVHGSTWEWSLP